MNVIVTMFNIFALLLTTMLSTQLAFGSENESSTCLPAQVTRQAPVKSKSTVVQSKSKVSLQKQQALIDEPATYKPRTLFKLNGPLQGKVDVNVPRTPEEVARYLAYMRQIIHNYESLAVASVLGAEGLKTDFESIESARLETVNMINRIRAIVPPAELKNKHNELATTLSLVGEAVQGASPGGGFAALASFGSILSRLHDTLERYHSGVLSCIAYYGLSTNLDPFSSESEETKQRLGNAIGDTQSRMLKSFMSPSQTSASDLSPDLSRNTPANLSSDLVKSLFGNADAGSLNSSLPKGLENADINSLVKQLGGQETGELGQLLKQLNDANQP